MIRVQIKNMQNQITHGAVFQTQIEANAWVELVKPTGAWGKPERVLGKLEAETNGEILENAIETIVQSGLFGEEVTFYKFAAEFTVEFVDITDEVKKQSLVEYGRKAQDFGRQILAEVLAINELKIESGALTQAQLLAIFQSEELKPIERLLGNGSLNTAKSLIMQLDETYFSNAEKTEIIQKINEFLIKENKLAN